MTLFKYHVEVKFINHHILVLVRMQYILHGGYLHIGFS